MKKTLASIVGVVALVGMGVSVPALANGGGSSNSLPCDVPSVTVTDSPSWVETIPGKPEVWANFKPNKQTKKFVGPPVWPTDPRGTWTIHNQIPPGHAGYSGVYQRGNGNGDWFYQQAAVPVKFIKHDAVTHEEDNPNYPCVTETPTDPTTEPTDDSTTEVPVTEPPVDVDLISPSWSVKVDCRLPLRDWIVAPSTKQYDVVVEQVDGSHMFNLTFTIVAGDFEFAPGDYDVAEDGKTALVSVFLPVVRCVPGDTPKTPESETKCSVHKCVKITRDNSGKVVDREVIKYGNVNEEGL